MTTKTRRADLGASMARELVGSMARELTAARTNASLSQEQVSRAAGLSRSKYSRIERGVSPEVSIASIAKAAAALGLKPSVRLFPVGDPVRDTGQVALLARLRARCARTADWRTEVAFPIRGDLRAWDAVIENLRHPVNGRRLRVAVEAETRPNDVQALDRRLALKERDGGADRVILLLANSRHNRALLRGAGQSLQTRFPGDGREALKLLEAGIAPPANSLILL